ncbi:hypothetical protein [Kurthia gibsonii]|uniref:hypothetical protein n=1 Tax=Kurthia gibsonii TaxID=33946 RepID=UPI0031B6F65D
MTVKDMYDLQRHTAMIDLLSTEINVAMQRKEYLKVEDLLNMQLQAIREIKRIRNQQQYAITMRDMAKQLNERGIAAEVVRKLE